MEMGFAAVLIWTFVVLLVASGILLIFYRFVFLRRPDRNVPKGDVLVSPASGRVARIIRIDKGGGVSVRKGLVGRVKLLVGDTVKRGYVVVIVMTPFDVHFQRCPVDAEVRDVSYRKGKFLNAVRDASSLQSLQNERNEILLHNARIGSFKVVQVAGFLARRISCFVRPKQKIHKGEELGLISLGSQVLLVIPEMDIEVRPGQKVVDGETVIARF